MSKAKTRRNKASDKRRLYREARNAKAWQPVEDQPTKQRKQAVRR